MVGRVKAPAAGRIGHPINCIGLAVLGITLAGCNVSLGPFFVKTGNGTPPAQYQATVDDIGAHARADSAAVDKACLGNPESLVSDACIAALQTSTTNTRAYVTRLGATPPPDCMAAGGAALTKAVDAYSADDAQLMAAAHAHDREAISMSFEVKSRSSGEIDKALQQLGSESTNC